MSQRTSRRHFGTGVLPMRYEDPIRVAEDASTLDLLSGGRLELRLSSGIPTPGILDPVFGSSPVGFSAESQKRVLRLREALAGAALVNSGEGFMSIPTHTDLRVSPPAPGLVDRLWYGAGTVSSAARTGAQGFDLQVSTLNGEETGVSFEERQLAQIRAYREAFAARVGQAVGGRRAPRITAGRIIVPLDNDADRAEHRAFIDGYRSVMPADGRHHDPSEKLRFSRIFDGSPERITDDLLADSALSEATQLMVTLPAEGSLASHKRILQTIAERIAPHLGWAGATPAAAAAPDYGTAA
ncbi:LLM class flavin-dependent oxidoreductase [Subtercola boreus]|uniref:LLM class flavin-dependent oxidoreductase n=1 Tax=Subtercola boreus TaxID=120213 RepID=UPI001559BCD2|nr:LLM class flavin-dependent oxidoreductase [Subtercola boreus]